MVMMVLLNEACTWTRPMGTDFFSFFLNVFFFPVFAGAFAMSSSLGLSRRLLLIRDGAAARALARAGVGVGPLAANGQSAAVPQPAIRAHFDQPLHVHRELLAQVTLDRPFGLQNLADAVHLVFAQIRDFLVRIHTRAV